jgi:hypothetical protein
MPADGFYSNNPFVSQVGWTCGSTWCALIVFSKQKTLLHKRHFDADRILPDGSL